MINEVGKIRTKKRARRYSFDRFPVITQSRLTSIQRCLDVNNVVTTLKPCRVLIGFRQRKAIQRYALKG